MKIFTKKSPEPKRVACKFYKTFKEELILVYHKLTQKIRREGNPSQIIL
jgi:hypothetical protein